MTPRIHSRMENIYLGRAPNFLFESTHQIHPSLANLMRCSTKLAGDECTKWHAYDSGYQRRHPGILEVLVPCETKEKANSFCKTRATTNQYFSTLMHAQQNDTQTSHLNWAGAHFSDRLATQNHHPDHLKYPPKATKQCHLPKSENQTLNFNTTYHFTQSAQSASLHITLPLRKSEAPHTLSGVARRFLYRNSSSCTWRDSWVYEKDAEGMGSG